MLPLHVPPSYPGGAGRGLMASVSSSSGGRGGGGSGGSMRGSLGSMSSLHDVGAPRTEDSATMRKVTALGLVVGVSSFVILVVFAVLSARMLNMEAAVSSTPGVPSVMGGGGVPSAAGAAAAKPGYGGVTPIELVPFGDSRVEKFMAKSNCSLNFFLAWTTSAAKFSLRYRRTIESTLKFHPDACLIIYSPTMTLDHFQAFWDLGYNIIVERPDVPYLIRGTPAEAWYAGIDKWKEGQYFFSHITEIIRLATLWKYGGVYLDTDVVVMQELYNLKNAVGTELSDERGEAKVLNGAVLAFEKGSKFIHEAMVEFNTTYRIDSWGWNGPQLVTRVASRFPQGEDLQILPTIGFYPIHWAKVRKYFTDEDPADQHAVWERMKRETYLFHYWNKITVKLTPSSGSLMYKVLNNFCLFCDDTGPDG